METCSGSFSMYSQDIKIIEQEAEAPQNWSIAEQLRKRRNRTIFLEVCNLFPTFASEIKIKKLTILHL